ncbi:MAG TPA: Ig domain-containing protein [Acidimicrobiales bacterium]|nr:Ig domain-containing protein [Acidimicrobiales bacterium]
MLLAGLVLATTAGAAAAGPGPRAQGQATISDPTAGHAYRHGAVPLRARATPTSEVPDIRSATATTTSTAPVRHAEAGTGRGGPVRFNGGAVITGSPKVYLVLWGSQWATPSGDPDGLASNLEGFFNGLGTDNELWSAILTQYCQGVASGTKTCPVSPLSNHVAYPSSTVLAGVWEDTSAPSPAAATATQIAQEAADAAERFSNPPEAQYVVVSPSGSDPDGWLDPRYGYCAYHDDTQDPSLAPVSGPDVPYTNMPYVPDVGAECSSFAVPGVLDGADETISHEYAETLTDPFPFSGWLGRGGEIADKCENLDGGSPGGSTYVTLSTGTFAMQGIWANDLGRRGGCETAHTPILTTNPGRQRGTDAVPVSLQVSAADVRGQALTYVGSGLPAGLTINATTGLISGTPTGRGRTATSIVVSDTSASATIAFTWTIRR